jgi:hypothetical protein
MRVIGEGIAAASQRWLTERLLKHCYGCLDALTSQLKGNPGMQAGLHIFPKHGKVQKIEPSSS